MAEIYDLSTNAAANNGVPPDGFPENMQYSQVNNSAREQMAVLARYIEATGAIVTTGADPAYILTITQAIIALVNGMIFTFKADKTNTAAPTLQINALGAVAIVDSAGVALAVGDIVSGGIYEVQYDGVSFQLISSGAQFTSAEKTKLAGVEAGAAADQTGAEIKALYEAEADTNAFDDAAQTKLASVETGAAADQTGAEIKALYEAEADTNAFTDSDQAAVSTIGEITRIVKLVEEPKSNDVSVGVDAELDTGLTLDGTAFYRFEAYLIFDSASVTPDVQFTVLCTATGIETSFSYSAVERITNSLFNGTAPKSLGFSNAQSQSLELGEVNVEDTGVRIAGFIRWAAGGANSRQVAIHWSQNTSNATATRLLRGSYMIVEKLADI